MLIGKKLRKIRELKEIKQETIAKEIGISKQAYGKIERDETDISVSRLIQIAKILGVDISHILSFDEKAYIYQLPSFHQNNISTEITNGNFNLKEVVEMLKESIFQNRLLLEKIIIYLDKK